jgi:WD domain, G-beta repeat
VAISPDTRWVVTASDDKTARLWDLSAKDPAANPVVLRGHDGWVNTVAISPSASGRDPDAKLRWHRGAVAVTDAEGPIEVAASVLPPWLNDPHAFLGFFASAQRRRRRLRDPVSSTARRN